jgi:hypothetical protein
VFCSLEKHDEARDTGGAPSNLETSSGLESRYCTHAAVGLGYNGSLDTFYPEPKSEYLEPRICDPGGDSFPAESSSP